MGVRYVNHETYEGGHESDPPLLEAWEIEIETTEGTDAAGTPITVDGVALSKTALEIVDNKVETDRDGRGKKPADAEVVDLVAERAAAADSK